MNEAKIRDLEVKLARVQVAGAIDVPTDMVFLGATVRLKDLANGREKVCRLVGQLSEDGGPDELDEVTPSSPMGTALMKARVSETVRVDLPTGEKRFLVVAILG
jgi:transcription elongation factor GreA